MSLFIFIQLSKQPFCCEPASLSNNYRFLLLLELLRILDILGLILKRNLVQDRDILIRLLKKHLIINLIKSWINYGLALQVILNVRVLVLIKIKQAILMVLGLLNHLALLCGKLWLNSIKIKTWYWIAVQLVLI